MPAWLADSLGTQLPSALYDVSLGQCQQRPQLPMGLASLSLSSAQLSSTCRPLIAPRLSRHDISTFAATPAAPPMPTPAPVHRLPAVRSLVPAVAYQAKEQESLSEALKKAGKRALGGGIPGAAAMAVQVGCGGAPSTGSTEWRFDRSPPASARHP